MEQPATFDSAYNTTIDVTPRNLGNIPATISIDLSQTSNPNYMVLTEEPTQKLDKGVFTNIEEYPLSPKEIIEITESFGNKMQELEYSKLTHQGTSCNITKFYICVSCSVSSWIIIRYSSYCFIRRSLFGIKRGLPSFCF